MRKRYLMTEDQRSRMERAAGHLEELCKALKDAEDAMAQKQGHSMLFHSPEIIRVKVAIILHAPVLAKTVKDEWKRAKEIPRRKKVPKR